MFYNSKKLGPNTTPPPIPETHTMRIQDIIIIDNIDEEITTKKVSLIQFLKESAKKELEKEYGALNINARNYIPRKKQN